MEFREHRGSLADSMETCVTLPNRLSALVHHIRQLLKHFPTAPAVNRYTISFSVAGADDRIGWKQTFYVVLKGYGVVGMCDEQPR